MMSDGWIEALRRRIDWFLIGMLVAVGLAWMFPEPGAAGGWMHPELLTKAGVALVFFLHGLALPFEALKAGMLKWRVHLLIQSCTYLFFPLLGIALLMASGAGIPAGLRVGIFYLCALPSTVSSSVALTAAAGGNVPVAVFNATLSALLGVVLTPLWMSGYTEAGGSSIPVGQVMIDLVKWLVIPLAAGQLARPWLGQAASRHKRFIHWIDRGTILLLVYTSFCDSMVRGVWTQHGGTAIAASSAASVVLLAAALLATKTACRLLHFSEKDRIAVVFCGSKKTLASGVPMASLMFGADPNLGLILLPIMIYHPLQLIVCGVMAGRWAQARTPASALADSPR